MADGGIQYLFEDIDRALRFTVAMNTFKAARAKMIWYVNTDKPCEVRAYFCK